MPKLNFIAKGFRPDLGGRRHDLYSIEVTWAELIWAGITVGRKCWEDVIQHGYHSFLEIIYRIAILKANLKSTCQGDFIKTDAYNSLDTSEKSAISYFLGLSFAKLAISRLLSVPWLIHLDCFDQKIVLEGDGKTRPDLIGRNLSEEWCVFEAKGRTGSIFKKLKKQARIQAQSIISINDMAPSMRGISLLYFSSDKLRLHLEVLEEINSEAVDLEIPNLEEIFLQSYYQSFVSLIESSTETKPEADVVRVEDQEIIFVNLQGADLDVGLNSEVLAILKSKSQGKNALMSICNLYSQHHADIALPATARLGNNDTTFIGSDGVFVRLGLSWIQKK